MSALTTQAIALLKVFPALLAKKNQTIERLMTLSANAETQIAQVVSARDAALSSVADLQAQLEQETAAKLAAMANDAADAETIRQATADRDAQAASNADLQAQLATINSTATEAIAAAEAAKAEIEAVKASVAADEAELAEAVAASQAVVDADATTEA